MSHAATVKDILGHSLVLNIDFTACRCEFSYITVSSKLCFHYWVEDWSLLLDSAIYFCSTIYFPLGEKNRYVVYQEDVLESFLLLLILGSAHALSDLRGIFPPSQGPTDVCKIAICLAKAVHTTELTQMKARSELGVELCGFVKSWLNWELHARTTVLRWLLLQTPQFCG